MKQLTFGILLLVMLTSFAYYTTIRFHVLEHKICQLEQELNTERALNKRLIKQIDGWRLYK